MSVRRLARNGALIVVTALAVAVGTAVVPQADSASADAKPLCTAEGKVIGPGYLGPAQIWHQGGVHCYELQTFDFLQEGFSQLLPVVAVPYGHCSPGDPPWCGAPIDPILEVWGVETCRSINFECDAEYTLLHRNDDVGPDNLAAVVFVELPPKWSPENPYDHYLVRVFGFEAAAGGYKLAVMPPFPKFLYW